MPVKTKNIDLYNLYLKTKDVQHLHQIILNHNEVIYKAIDYTLKKFNASNKNAEEDYSLYIMHYLKS